jgi:hypothetical protein
MEKQKLTNKEIERYLKARQPSIAFGNLMGKIVSISLMTAIVAGSIWLAGIAILALTGLFI